LATLPQAEAAWRPYSLSGLWRLLQAAHIHYKRGRHHVHSPDPDYLTKREAVQECVNRAQQAPTRVVTYFLDEFSFYRHPTVAAAWHPAGHDQPRATRSHRSNIYHRILGALNATTGQVVFRMAKKTDVAFICRFLRDLRQSHPDAQVLNVVLDNWYRVHDHPHVQRTAADVKITLVYLPTYAPWLNPIEKLWRKAYQEILHLHRDSDRWPELKQRIRTFLAGFDGPSPELLRYVGLLPI
jgi:transposase